MTRLFVLAIMLAAAVVNASPQEADIPAGREMETKAAGQKIDRSASVDQPSEEVKAENPDAKNTVITGTPVEAFDRSLVPRKDAALEPVRNMRPMDYVRPDAKRRLERYIQNVAGPMAITRYAATAGLLTLRNTPKEWDYKPDGYGKRIANVAAKSLIENTTMYALDEMLKVDSTFYLSRDRSTFARLRNSVFSAVTARNRRGKRVIGIPRLAGSFLSEVTSSVVWYPNRYDHDHGLKGGAISIGVNTGFNIFREFILKR